MLKVKYTACMRCACQVEYKTNAQVYCAECRLSVIREKARIASEKKRRAQGIAKQKGVERPCHSCGRLMVAGGKHQKWCVGCKKEQQLIRARHHSRMVRVLPERRKTHNAWQAKNRKTPKGRVDAHMGTLIHRALKKNKAGRSWKTMVPYSWQELAAHLESQFQPGMTWKNHGEWHIDHIRPRASFAYTSPEDPAFHECWELSNLQPLWAQDNVRKGAKILEPQE